MPAPVGFDTSLDAMRIITAALNESGGTADKVPIEQLRHTREQLEAAVEQSGGDGVIRLLLVVAEGLIGCRLAADRGDRAAADSELQSAKEAMAALAEVIPAPDPDDL
ncbi:MAG: hypothetical protein JO086_08260 [Acidimicrobiia bacterium]|nr:hypothetical protein [Acidimicrobiia bacterium]